MVMMLPNIWIQSVQFAIVKYKRETDPNFVADMSKLSSSNFYTLFNSHTPADISAGDNIVLWYSVTVYAETTFLAEVKAPTGVTTTNLTLKSPSMNGTIFIHGMFFAHNKESKLTGKKGVGPIKQEYYSDSKETILKARKWERYGG